MMLDEIKARLASESLVATGFVVETGFLPTTPDKVIVLYETGGSAPEEFFGGDTLDRPGLHVVVRGGRQDYQTPRDAIETVYQGITQWGAFVASGVQYVGLRAIQAPFPWSRDAQERVLFSVNFLALKEPS